MDWNEFLGEAVAEKEADLVRQALAEGADPNYAEPPESQFSAFVGTTTLFWAVSGGDYEIVRLLLEAGAKVAAEAQASSSSLHAAVEDANLPIINLLLNYDAAVALNWFDYIDRTPLIIAVEMENIPIARRLLDAGGDVNAHDAPHIGETALHCAVENGSLEMVELLLKAGANPKIKGWMWLTPLDEASGTMGRVFMNFWNKLPRSFRNHAMKRAAVRRGRRKKPLMHWQTQRARYQKKRF